MTREQQGENSRFWRSKAGIVTCAFLGIAGILLILEHRAHVLDWLPYLILLACPLLHVFMHGGHGGHGAHGGNSGHAGHGEGGATPPKRDDAPRDR